MNPTNLDTSSRVLSSNGPQNAPSKTHDFLKRSIDLLFATGGLVITSPLLPFIALAIKLDSTGPVFFLQERMGLNGEPFTIRKLRSMHLPENKPGTEDRSSHNQAAVTRVGTILRRFSIDELPQLINILRGHMSIVGPRPYPANQVDLTDPNWQRVLAAKPGLTSPGTIETRRSGYTLPLEERQKLDQEHIAKQSILADLITLLKTLSVIFKGK